MKLTAVVKKEVVHHVMSSRYVTVTLLLLALSLLAAVVGSGDYLRRSHNYATHQEQSQAELDSLHVYSFLQPVVVRGPEPLSMLDRGLDDRLAEEIRLEVPSLPAAANRGHPGNDFLAGSPDLDLTMIVQLVLGLLALLLTFDAVTGEKEAGTLPLVLAHDVSRFTVVAGKFLGACVALLLPLLAGTAVTLGVLAIRAGVVLDAGRWQRLAGLVAVYVLYMCLMALLGLAISLWSRSTSSSLVLSLLAWLTVVILMPQMGALAAELSATGRLRQEMREQVRQLEEQRRAEIAEISVLRPRRLHDADFAPVIKREGGATLRMRYGTALFYDRLAAYCRREIPIRLDYADRIFATRQRYEQQQRQVQRRAAALFRLSPASLMERAAESLAGTSRDDRDEHLAAAREYRKDVIGYLEAREAFGLWRWFTDDTEPLKPWTTLLGVAPEAVDENNYEELSARFSSKEIQDKVAARHTQYEAEAGRRLDLSDLPKFADRPLELPGAVHRILPELGLLLFFNLILAAAVLVAIRRYRPGATSVRARGSRTPAGHEPGPGTPGSRTLRDDGAAVRGVPRR